MSRRPRAVVLGLLRHGTTDWNREGRLQGRAERALDPAEEARLRGAALPALPRFDAVRVSPLQRTRQTAAALATGMPGWPGATAEDSLVEMDWGAWEGCRPADLRRDPGSGFAAAEAQGLDLMPPGGESPRMVQDRLSRWLAVLDRPTLAVTHKGVIRALLALAHDWPMLGRAPAKLDWQALHAMLVVDGRPRPWCYNLPLVAAPARSGNGAGPA
ncbi:histidine phosphatase family protein [Marinibaculum pumilum]|uniref:Histidine phosphatase family protein n=1 Tax=Marinibaculum pumilum TaxID=1766165 RepID=A0ABV7KXZ6_9PROT